MNFRRQELPISSDPVSLGQIANDLYTDLNSTRLLHPDCFRIHCIFEGPGGRMWKMSLEIDPKEDPS